MAPKNQRAKRTKTAKSQEAQTANLDDTVPFLDLDTAIVEAVARELAKPAAPMPMPAAKCKAILADEDDDPDSPGYAMTPLLAVSACVARLVLASSAEWRVDLRGLSYVAWCLGVKALSEKKGLGGKSDEPAMKDAKRIRTGIPPGCLILDATTDNEEEDEQEDVLRTCGLLSDMASQGLIRGLALHGRWGTETFPPEEPWARFLSDVAPLLTHLDLSGFQSSLFSDRRLAPLTSCPASFPQLRSIVIIKWIASARRMRHERSDNSDYSVSDDDSEEEEEGDYDIYSFKRLLDLLALPALGEIILAFDKLDVNDLHIPIECVTNIMSKRRGKASPLLMRTALTLATRVADVLAGDTCSRGKLDSILPLLGPFFRRILSLLLQPPEGPQWTPYALYEIRSLAAGALASLASFHVERGEVWTEDLLVLNGGSPFAFGIDLKESGHLEPLLGLALPRNSDAAAAAALSGSFVDSGRPGETPLELVQQLPRQAAKLLNRLCIANIFNGQRRGVSAAALPGTWGAVLAAFCDALSDFDRPYNHLRAAQFFLYMDEDVLNTARPLGHFVSGLAQRVRESKELQDLRAASASAAAPHTGHVNPSLLPEWFRASAQILRVLRGLEPGAVYMRNDGTTYTVNLMNDDESVLLNLFSIRGLDLSDAKISIMPQLGSILGRAYDEPDCPDDVRALALGILRAFGRHARLYFCSNSFFSPGNTYIDGQVQSYDLAYIIPALALTFLSMPQHCHEEPLLELVRSIQHLGAYEGRSGWLGVGPVNVNKGSEHAERFLRLFQTCTATDALAPLHVRYAAIVFSAMFVSTVISKSHDGSSICFIDNSKPPLWTTFPSLVRLYQDLDPSLETLPSVPEADRFRIASQLPKNISAALVRSLPSLLALWASLSDADLADPELKYVPDALGLLVSAAVAAVPAGQAIPTGPFTAAELVARLVDWARPEQMAAALEAEDSEESKVDNGSESEDEKDGAGEGRDLARVCSVRTRKSAACPTLERLMYDDAMGGVLFTAPYQLLRRFALVLLHEDIYRIDIHPPTQPILAALARQARVDPSGVFVALRDTPLCSNRKWTDFSEYHSDDPTPALFAMPSNRCVTPAALEITALFLRHWLGIGPAVVLPSSSSKPLEVPLEIRALARSSLVKRLAKIASDSAKRVPRGKSPGGPLLRSMCALVLRALLSAVEGKDRADLVASVSPALRSLSKCKPRLKAKADALFQKPEPVAMTSTAAALFGLLQRVIDQGPDGVEARLGLGVGMEDGPGPQGPTKS